MARRVQLTVELFFIILLFNLNNSAIILAMKKRFRFLTLLPISALLLSGCAFIDFFKNLFNPTEEKESEKPKENVDISDVLYLSVGDVEEIRVTPFSKDVVIKTVSYISNDTSVAIIENNKVKGVAIGQTSISVVVKTERGNTFKGETKVIVSAAGKTRLRYTYDDYSAYNAYPFDNCPLEGEPKLLILPIWFSDSTEFIKESKKEEVRDDIRKTIIGTNEETGWRSVKTFYHEESFGKLNIKGTVADWYETNDSYLDYIDGGSETIGSKALSDYFSTHSSDKRTNYDTNGDGYLDGVIFVYAAPDCFNLGYEDMNNLWAYCSWTMASPNKTKPAMNVYFWGSYDFMYAEGSHAEAKTGKSSYGRGDTDYCNIDSHCFIHEFGHVLGLPDYYDYSGQYSPAAGFSMQDNNVGGHDPYSVLAYGWGEPYIPTETTTYEINDFQSSHDVILLANHSIDSPFDEYLLVELYSPTGLNKFDSDHCYLGRYPIGPEEYGIRVWHVDARLTYWNGYSWSTSLTSNPRKGYVYQAISNTYYDSEKDNKDAISVLGTDYADYNILELIRSDDGSGDLTYENMFVEDMTFDVSNHSSQFVNGLNMNNGQPLGWSFTVDEISNGTATITVTKN